MSYVHPAWIEYQRRRFTRHDAHRFIRPDADRFIKPDAAPPRAPEQAGAAIDEMSEAELLEYRHELAKLRFDWELFKLSLKARKAGFDPHQPRDDRGRWTDTGMGDQPGSGSDPSRDTLEVSASRKLPSIVKEYGKLTAREFVSRYCEARVNRELPGQFENMTIADIWNIARGGDARARTCMKLLQPRFKK